MRFDYDYVIVGGGMAADAAARGIREVDPSGSIAILGEEADQPYERPPLSKDLWRDPAAHEPFLGTAGATDAQLRKRIEAFQEQLGASVLERDAALRDRVLGSDGKVTGE